MSCEISSVSESQPDHLGPLMRKLLWSVGSPCPGSGTGALAAGSPSPGASGSSMEQDKAGPQCWPLGEV